jgi:serine/threonine-protein kinase
LREGSDEVSKDSEQATAGAVTGSPPDEKALSDAQGADDSSTVAPAVPQPPVLKAPPKVGASPVVPPLFGGPVGAPVTPPAMEPPRAAAPPGFSSNSAPSKPAVPGDSSRFAALLKNARRPMGSAAEAIDESAEPELELEPEVAPLSAAEVDLDDDFDDPDELTTTNTFGDDDDFDDDPDLDVPMAEEDDFGSPTPTSFDVDLSGDSMAGDPPQAPTTDETVVISTPAPEEPKTGQLTPRRDALFGTVLADRYRVLDLIGKGGMGKVYLAEHVAIGKKVAIKVLSQAYCHRPDQVKRFLREARAASTIEHENVIDITDFGEMPNGSVFFAMEYLQGEDLGKLLRRHGRLPWPRARRIILQICRALQAAHARGIIHRDMKPENCFLITRGGRRDFVKVLDFGIAKVVDEDRKVSHTLTQAGALIGTPEYMAPEQVTGEVADPRMDIYSIGCIMYQLLTGRLPFQDKTMFGVLTQQVNMKPPPLREVAPEADIPEEVEAIVLKAMEKTKEARYQTMLELVEAIAAAPRGGANSHGDRAMTMGTSNLAAAAAEARKLAEAHLASQASGAGPMQSGVSPHLTGAHAALSGSGAMSPLTTGSFQPVGASQTGPHAHFGSDSQPGTGSWDPAIDPSATASILVSDPKLLFRLAIGLGVVVLLLLIVLLYMLFRSPEVEETPADSGAVVTAPADSSEAPTPADGDGEGTPDEPSVEAAAGATTSGGDDDGTTTTGDADDTTTTTTGEPEPDEPATPVKAKTKKTKTKSTKSTSTTTKPPSGIVLPNLDLREVSQAMSKIRSDVERCKTQIGDPAKVKLDVTFSGGTGKVTKVDKVSGNAKVADCIAKVIKRKVRVSRFDKTNASSRRTF